jgi:Tol biopolymer transport system component
MKNIVLLVAIIGIVFSVGCGFGGSKASGVAIEPFSVPPEPPKIAFTSDRDGQGLMELYYMNWDGTGQTKVPLSQDYAGLVWDPVISPDGSRIVFSYYGPDLRPLTSGADSFSPHFSADGTHLIFVRFTASDTPHVWVMNSDGGGPPTDIVAASTFAYDSAQFSPDGTKIIALRDSVSNGSRAQRSRARMQPSFTQNDAQHSIVSMGLDGANEQVISTEVDETGGPQLSPNGLNLIYEVHMTQNAVVSELVANHTRTVLTPTDSNNYDPVVVGDYIYFVSGRDGNSAIYRINIDGSGEVRLTDPAQNSTLGMAVH